MGTLVIIILLLASIIILPWMIKKVSSSRLKKWQKGLINSIVTGIILISVFFVGSVAQGVTYTSKSLIKNPAVAREYLNSTEINVELPEFTVERHTSRHVGGDDSEEWWEIEFKDRLPESFLSRLDSLCSSDRARWSRITRDDNGRMTRDLLPCYIYSYWDPERIEYKETITIFPKRKMAWLSHLKI